MTKDIEIFLGLVYSNQPRRPIVWIRNWKKKGLIIFESLHSHFCEAVFFLYVLLTVDVRLKIYDVSNSNSFFSLSLSFRPSRGQPNRSSFCHSFYLSLKKDSHSCVEIKKITPTFPDQRESPFNHLTENYNYSSCESIFQRQNLFQLHVFKRSQEFFKFNYSICLLFGSMLYK